MWAPMPGVSVPSPLVGNGFAGKGLLIRLSCRASLPRLEQLRRLPLRNLHLALKHPDASATAHCYVTGIIHEKGMPIHERDLAVQPASATGRKRWHDQIDRKSV
jgi:hypothetical protein